MNQSELGLSIDRGTENVFRKRVHGIRTYAVIALTANRLVARGKATAVRVKDWTEHEVTCQRNRILYRRQGYVLFPEVIGISMPNGATGSFGRVAWQFTA